MESMFNKRDKTEDRNKNKICRKLKDKTTATKKEITETKAIIDMNRSHKADNKTQANNINSAKIAKEMFLTKIAARLLRKSKNSFMFVRLK